MLISADLNKNLPKSAELDLAKMPKILSKSVDFGTFGKYHIQLINYDIIGFGFHPTQ